MGSGSGLGSWDRGIVGLGSWELTLQLADSFDYAGFLYGCGLFAALGFVLLTELPKTEKF
jgi:hypothetical protein